MHQKKIEKSHIEPVSGDLQEDPQKQVERIEGEMHPRKYINGAYLSET